MQTTYNLQTSELNTAFITSIKNLYQNKKIEIIISEVIDETEYLLQNPINKEKLLQAVNNVEADKNMKEIDLEQIKSLLKSIN